MPTSGPVSVPASRAPKRRARAPRRRREPSPTKVINLALQGGGAHGAFTWGILDRLLEDERIVIEGVSGASAGAINAALLAYGAIDGGAEGARALLDRFWRRLATLSHFSPLRATPMERMAAGWTADWSAGQMLFDLVTRVFSPYQMNPFAMNPLRDLLEELIDFERLRLHSPVRLFVSATNVRTGKVRVFRTEEMSADVLLASACLPSVHQAVQIGDDHFWDGGFTSNPAILPLVSEVSSADIVVVQATPAHHPEVPVTARDIRGRLNHIVFNAPLIREIQSIAWMQDAIKDADVTQGSLAHRLRQVRIHHIDADDALAAHGASSALHPEWEFVAELRDLGRERADDWLADTFERLGVETTADLAARFL
ncbi:MAG: patatin-like phospholipase family protein [Alphaproteobacteria bacterium]